MRRNPNRQKFVLCVRNKGYRASLQLLKFYERIPDARGEQHGLMRVIDEDGEGYLYPAEWFVSLDLPREVESALKGARGRRKK